MAAPPVGIGFLGATTFVLATIVLARSVGARLVTAETSALGRIHVMSLLAVAQVVLLFQVLGLAGWLTFPVVLAVQSVLAATSYVFLKAPRCTEIKWSELPSWLVPAGLALTVIATMFALSGPSPTADTMRYHLPNAASVLQTGSLRSLPYAEPGDSTGTEP